MIEAEFGSGYWDGFQRYMVEDSEHNKEWRFGGALGFGGKVYFSGYRLYVGCYPEDIGENRERIAALNARLAEVLRDA